jgi:hypothetical protein
MAMDMRARDRMADRSLPCLAAEWDLVRPISETWNHSFKPVDGLN